MVEYLRVFSHVGFFICVAKAVATARDVCDGRAPVQPWRGKSRKSPAPFQEQRTGHVPQSVAVVLSGETLVITLHGALSPAEKDLARSPEGAAQVQEFHRQLFANASDSLRREIQNITGVRGARGDRGSRGDNGYCRAGLHDGHHGAGVSAGSKRSGGHLEREWTTRSAITQEVLECWS